MIKAVFFDIDGTLYDANKEYVSPSSIEAIHALKKQGCLVGICTGRSRNAILGASNKLLELPFDVYITSGGGCSYYRDGRSIHHTYFTKEQVEKAFQLALDASFDLDISFIDKEGEGLLAPCGKQGKINYDWFHVPIPKSRKPHLETISHLLFACEEKYHKLAEPYIKSLSYFTSSESSIDCYPTNVNKAYGIFRVASELGFSLDEVMAFGDSGNDVEMLEAVGLGIAMGNGNEEAKSAADYVTSSMYEDGIMKALKKFEVIE